MSPATGIAQQPVFDLSPPRRLLARAIRLAANGLLEDGGNVAIVGLLLGRVGVTSVQVRDVAAAHQLEVGDDDAVDAARLEHPQHLRQQHLGDIAIQVL